MDDKLVDKTIPDEFLKIIKDFVRDITSTFPEYKTFVDKWWKNEDDPEKNKNSLKFIFNYCLKKYPPRFFDILYQNNDIFKEDTIIDTEFLPYIHFKNIWHYDISDKTKDTIWKYLQLILFSVVSTLKTQEHFGETAKLFNSVDKADFQEKLKSSLEEIQNLQIVLHKFYMFLILMIVFLIFLPFVLQFLHKIHIFLFDIETSLHLYSVLIVLHINQVLHLYNMILIPLFYVETYFLFENLLME